MATLTATLTDFGIPLGSSARVTARVDGPGGVLSTLALVEGDAGRYAGQVATEAAGVYRILVSAQGNTLRGEPFTREQLRTLGVWSKGDDRPPTSQEPATGRPGPCDLLKCLLSGRSLEEAAKRAGIDLDEVRACLDKTC